LVEKIFEGIFVDGHPCGEGQLYNYRTGETISAFFSNEYCQQEPSRGSRLQNFTFDSDRHNYQTGFALLSFILLFNQIKNRGRRLSKIWFISNNM
jgi:hypothetical protein